MCIIFDIVKFSVMVHLFNIFGWSLQCQSFEIIRGKAVTFSFQIWESLQDRQPLVLWCICIDSLRERERDKGKAGEEMTVYICYNVSYNKI